MPVPVVDAAVVAVLRPEPDGVATLLIQRTERPSDAASGQVALPGGRIDSSDRSAGAAALRELEEEVGLAAPDLEEPLRFVGTFYAPALGLNVAAFSALLATRARTPYPAAPEEVASVFWLPPGQLERSTRVTRVGRHGPLEVDAVVYEGHVLWGFTRRLLVETFERLAPSGPVEVPSGPSGRP